MKISSSPLFAVMSGWLCLVHPARAETSVYWNAGGTGNWSSGPGDKNWNLTVGGAGPDFTWPDTGGEVAVFQDAAGGAVSIFSSVQVAGIIQDGANYRLEAGILELVADAGGTAPFIEVVSGSLAVDAGLDGVAGLVKRGEGVLLLSGSNSYSGATSVVAGTLLAGREDVFSATDRLTIDAGATLGLDSYDQTVGTLVSNGRIDGPGTLTAASYLLGDGSEVSGHLGEGTLTTSGSVLLTGTSAASTVAIGAGILRTDGDNLADAAAVTLAPGSTWSLDGSEVVGSLVSNGGAIRGEGLLNAGSYTLNDGSSVVGRLGDGLITTQGSVTLAGQSGTGPLQILSGTLDFTGTSAASGVRVAAGATLLMGGNFSDGAVLTNGGAITVSAADTIGSYVSDAGNLTGGGVLTASNYLLNNGSVVTGHLGAGVLTTRGDVLFSGSSAASEVRVENGLLSLRGIERLQDGVEVTVAGRLDVAGIETIGSLKVNGGSVTGTGLLKASTYQLNDGSQVSSALGGGILTSSGAVRFSGTSAADVIRVADGTLINSGVLGTGSTSIEIAAGARLVAAGTQRFQTLSTSGSGAAIWQGTLENRGTVAPGTADVAGMLRVEGDFTNMAGAHLAFDVGPGAGDRLQVTGLAILGGTLDLRKLGAGEIEAMVPYSIIQAGAVAGNFSALTENLDGAVYFDPLNGSITRLDGEPSAGLLAGLNSNEKSVWIALYDDVIDPGVTNVVHRSGQNPPYEITGGIASGQAPELLYALNASLSPAGVDVALLSGLSPESYLSIPDYAIQATRQHRRTAWSAPALPATAHPDSAAASGSKSGGAKDGTGLQPADAWELFTAVDGFDGGTSASENGADYDIRGAGFLVGGRWVQSERLRIAAYIGGDDGEIQGQRLDADAAGFVTGLSANWLLNPRHQVHLQGGVSYGRFDFEGSRQGVDASASGWSRGSTHFSGVNADVVDLFLGIDGVAYQRGGLRIVPSVGLNYTSASSDGFRESGGDAIPLAVRSMGRDSCFSEWAAAVQYDVTSSVSLEGRAGFQLDLRNDNAEVTARFKDGTRTISATGTPLADELLFGSLAATWSLTDRIRVGGGYRIEVRGDADALHSLGISSTIRF